MFFKFLLFSGKWGSRVKCCEKNKMDNAQNGYSSADNTVKIKKKSYVNPPITYPPHT